MKCPVFKENCLRTKCAWWDKASKQCCALSICNVMINSANKYLSARDN